MTDCDAERAAPALPAIHSLVPCRSGKPPPAQRVTSEPVGRRTHALRARVRSRAHGGALSWQAVPPPPAKVSLPRSPRLRALATPCAARTNATSRTSRGAGALGPEAPAEQQEEAVGRDGRATRVSAHARARSAVLEGWVWAHPSTEARSGWREARYEHVISSPSRSAGQSSAQRRCRSTGVRGGISGSAAS